ncbi:MAG: hypothetical protein AB8G15_04295 [Saprospiraceae bacterium]
MKDNLEDFITENRAAFDEATPNLKVWADIDKRIDQPQSSRSIFPVLRKLAAVFALLGIGALIGISMLNQKQLGSDNNLAALGNEYQEIEAFYQVQISQKVAQLANFQYDQSIKEDLVQLDEFLEELKVALQEAPKEKEEEIINAMINNYKTRVELLERVLEHLKSNDTYNQRSSPQYQKSI